MDVCACACVLKGQVYLKQTKFYAGGVGGGA